MPPGEKGELERRRKIQINIYTQYYKYDFNPIKTAIITQKKKKGNFNKFTPIESLFIFPLMI